MSTNPTSTDATSLDTGSTGNTVLVMDPARRAARASRPAVTLDGALEAAAQAGGADAPGPDAGARIILFPVRGAAPVAQGGDAQQRLTRALASLDAALSEQRTAMAGWRDSLDHLRKATTGLGLSLQRYQRTLGKLGADVSDLHAQAVRLEKWADDTLTRSAPRKDDGPATARRD